MKKLQRPLCNINFQFYITNGNIWKNLKPEDKSIIKNALLTMTDNRCSYCEMEIVGDNWHIEHLAPQKKYHKLIFAWENLFCSCNDNNTCGRYKDNVQKYSGNSEDLIKPDKDNPNDYLSLNIQDGSFYEKNDHIKASNTIKYFNLNAIKLKRFRLDLINIAKSIIDQYQDIFCDLEDEDIELHKDYHQMMIEEILENYQESNVENLGFIQSYICTLVL